MQSLSNFIQLENLGSINTNKVSIGELDLYFSYKTIVAFHSQEQGLKVCCNQWSKTTGKLLNSLEDKKQHINPLLFNQLLENEFKKIGFISCCLNKNGGILNP